MQLYVKYRREWEQSLREKQSLTSEEKHKRIRARQKQKQLQFSSRFKKRHHFI